jgi:hypothetical protein
LDNGSTACGGECGHRLLKHSFPPNLICRICVIPREGAVNDLLDRLVGHAGPGRG